MQITIARDPAVGRSPRPCMFGSLATETVLAPSDFFTGLRKKLKAKLPAPLQRFNSTRRGRLMKVHFGEPAFHYEAWHHAGAGRLEIGLHFEASAAENERAFEFFRSRMVEAETTTQR